MMSRTRTTRFATAACALLSVVASGCIAGMGRIGAEEPRSFRAMIVDSCNGYTCRGHEGNVGNRIGIVLGMAPGPTFGPEPGRNAPVGFGGSSLMQIMVLTRVQRLAIGGGIGFDAYTTPVESVAASSGKERSQLMASFFDLRAALRLATRFSVHVGLGPAYGRYRFTNGDTTLGSLPWGWGGHLAVGIDYMFQPRRQRSGWGLRIVSNTTVLGGGDILGSQYHPLGTTVGGQIIWVGGR